MNDREFGSGDKYEKLRLENSHAVPFKPYLPNPLPETYEQRVIREHEENIKAWGTIPR